MTIDATTISSNTAPYGGYETSGRGGGILNDGYGIVSIQNGSIIGDAGEGNTAHDGGGIYNGGMVTLDASTVSANTATLGGGIYNGYPLGNLLIRNSSTLGEEGAGNSADNGGGIFNEDGSYVTMVGSSLLDNTSSGDGDAVYSDSSSMDAVSVTESCIVGNGDVAFFNNQSDLQTATGNWWGAADGPGPVGPGSGDTVSANVDFSGFLTTPPPICGGLSAPELVSPANGATIADSTPTFDWSDVTGATQYQVQVAGDAGFGSLAIDETVTSSTYTPSTALTDGTYHWRVRAGDGAGLWGSYSETWTVAVITGPPGAATLTSPSGGETMTSALVTYTWDEVAEATYYYLWVNNASGTAIHKVWYTTGEVCSGGTCSVMPSVSYTNGDYSWWIQTWNSYGYGPWSDAATFTFDDGSGPPGAATLTSPSGGETVTSAPVTYTWDEVSGADEYYLWINNAAGTNVYKQWHSAAAVCSGGVCAFEPVLSYISGTSYSWWIQARNSYGYGPWSSAATFTFDDGSGPPGAATLTSPSGGETMTSAPVTYQWDEVAGATYYYLWVNNAAGTAIHKVWYTDAVCSGGTCSVMPSVSYTSGSSYSWWIQTWNSYGYGPWSSAATFTFDDGSGPPGAATLTSPAGGETVTSAPVTYRWDEVAGATYYYLWVNNPSGTAIHKVWYTDAVCSGGVCSVTPSVSYTSGASYSWWIQSWNSYGYGPWSDAATFTFDDGSGPPGAATLTSPSGGETVTSAPVTYQWDEVAGATYYYLWVNNPSGTAIHKVWYTDAVCSGGTCSVTPSVSYTNGDYSWWIQTWNSYGYGPWSDAATFTFTSDTEAPSVPADLTAEAVSSSQVNLSWSASSDNVAVAGYRIYRDGDPTAIGVSDTTAYQDTGLAASTEYTYTVTAYDAAGNESGHSAPVPATTAASYLTMASLFEGTSMVKQFLLSLFGPNQFTYFGDPYTPVDSPWWDELQGAYTYRIDIPPDYDRPVSEGGLGLTKVRVEIFDAEVGNTVYDDHWVYDFETGLRSLASCGDRRNPCLLDTPNTEDNPYWFARVDENRLPGSTPASYDSSVNGSTLFRLYYYEQGAGGDLQPVDLAYYVSTANNVNTDLTWVSPGADAIERMPAFSDVAGSSSNPLDAAPEPFEPTLKTATRSGRMG